MQVRIALIAASTLAVLCSTAYANEWNVGCANLACLAVDNVGNVVYLDSNGSIVGKDKLQVASPHLMDRPVGPIRIACSAATISGDSTARCEMVDARGRIWIGPPVPNAANPIRSVTTSLPFAGTPNAAGECTCTCVDGRMQSLCPSPNNIPASCPATFCAVRPSVIEPVHPATLPPLATCRYANVCDQYGNCKWQQVCQ